MKNNVSIKQLVARVSRTVEQLQKYAVLGFVIFVAGIYGFVFFRITSLANEQPSNTVINDQVKGANVPHIDTAIVKQIQSLKDNSVSVQALFDQARSNPFQ